MNSGNPLMDLLLLQAITNKTSGGNITDPIDQVLKWAEEYKKKEKDKQDKSKAGSDKKVFSVKDLTFILAGFAVPGGLLMIQGWAYLWNYAYDAVHMMH